MRILLINGSPKTAGSASAVLLQKLKSSLLGKAEISEAGLHKSMAPEAVLEELKYDDTLVFSCPLYVDGLPSHLLSCLMQLETVSWQSREVFVYGIVNCGFYEGIQAAPALEILQNWCGKAGCIWNGGIGVGGGGGLAQMPDIKNGHGPKAPIENALKKMADKMLRCESQGAVYVSVAFPRFLYQLAAQMGWRQMIKANGKHTKDLGKRLT